MLRSVSLIVLLGQLVICQPQGDFDDYTDEEESNYGSRMWKGTRTTLEAHPYFVMVMAQKKAGNKFDPICGGVLITRQIVLTAARCIFFAYHKYQIRYSVETVESTTGNSYSDGKDRKISEMYRFPEWDFRNGTQNEYGLIKMEKPIRNREDVILLPEPDEVEKALNEPYEFTLVAMGESAAGDKGWVMKEANVSKVDRCPWGDFTNYTICSRGELGFATCPSDYGSPLLAKTPRGKVIIGIVYWHSCCDEGSLKDLSQCYTLYTRLDEGMPWILDTILQKTRCHCSDQIDFKWNNYPSIDEEHDSRAFDDATD